MLRFFNPRLHMTLRLTKLKFHFYHCVNLTHKWKVNIVIIKHFHPLLLQLPSFLSENMVAGKFGWKGVFPGYKNFELDRVIRFHKVHHRHWLLFRSYFVVVKLHLPNILTIPHHWQKFIRNLIMKWNFI